MNGEIFEEASRIAKRNHNLAYSDPSLEYIINLAGEEVVSFYLRLSSIDTSRKQKYLDSEEVQDTLRAFHLDAEKFWYLCLFIKDVVEGYADGIDAVSPREEISQLVALLNKVKSDFKRDGTYSLKSNAMLSLKVDKETVKIENPLTLGIIKATLYKFLQTDNKLLDDSSFNMTKIHKAPIYKIALFNMLLKWFLKDKVADKAIYASNGNKISKDKSLLISRMIFILGISDDESFFDEYKDDGSKLDYLKNYIKKYKNIEVPTYNSRYLLKGLFK